LEALSNEFEVRGVGKRAVSGRFGLSTQRRLFELMRRDLSGLAPVALMIDGVYFARALSAGGGRHREYACKALLADLIERLVPSCHPGDR